MRVPAPSTAITSNAAALPSAIRPSRKRGATPISSGCSRTGRLRLWRVGRPPGSDTSTRTVAFSGSVVSGDPLSSTGIDDLPSASVVGKGRSCWRAGKLSCTSPNR